MNLRIKPSTIPGAGRGLFAASKTRGPGEVVFARGDRIIEYGGEHIIVAELNNRYPGTLTAPYGLQEGAHVEDGACNRGPGTLANHAPQREANARYSFARGNPQRMVLVATKPIRNGTEIRCNYGRGYSLNEPTTKATRR